MGPSSTKLSGNVAGWHAVPYNVVACEVYLCAEESHCPGGNPGICAHHRDADTVACGDCADDAYEAGNECEPCGSASALPFIGAGIGVVIAVMAVTILVNKD